jgi:muramidase (phage lysozyme)
MAKLPDKYALSGPVALRSGRTIAQWDESGIGRGVAALGAGLRSVGGEFSAIGEQQRREGIVLDGAAADGGAMKELSDFERGFDADADFGTFEQRFEKGRTAIRDKWAAKITDPKARQKWSMGFDQNALGARNRVLDLGQKRVREGKLVDYKSGLEGFQSVIADANVSEAERARAKESANAWVDAAAGQGLLSPSEADTWRKNVIEGGEFVLMQRKVQQEGSRAIQGSTVSTEIPAEGRALLDTIAGTESPGYNVLNGGERFSSFDDHPRRRGAGGTTTAAGRYQFVKGTWDRARNATGVPDFSPKSQDVAAWWLAQADYKSHTGRDLLTDLQSKDANVQAGVRRALSNTWEGLKHLGDGNFANKIAAGPQSAPSEYTNLPPDRQLQLERQAESRDREMQVERRGALEIVTENAPAAIRSTGSYDGPLPTQDEFVAAYGEDGGQRYQQFATSVDVAQQSHDFRTMPASEIMKVVEDAAPSSSGDDAALQEKRYAVLQSAAESTIKARNADPVAYTQQAFPAVGAAWQAAQQSGDYQAAMTATAAAQRQLGMADLQLLPDVVADSAVAGFKDETKTEQQRIGSVANLVFSTASQEQRVAVFEQLVKAGLPEISAGAVRATARGDIGASRRLFEAAMIDVSKLPGKLPVTAAEIDEAVQSEIMDMGQVGDIYYGLSDGAADNYLTAQRDSKLMGNAIHIRLRKGEALEDAVAGVAKDLYGDVVPVTSGNAQILVPSDTDPKAVVRGLTASEPKLRAAMESSMKVPGEAKGATKAIVNAERAAYIDRVMSDGYYRNAEGGYAFIDPYTGLAISDERGRPIIVTDQEAQAVAGPEPIANPDTQGYGRELEDRARRDRELREQGMGTGGWFNAVPDEAPPAVEAPPLVNQYYPPIGTDSP